MGSQVWFPQIAGTKSVRPIRPLSRGGLKSKVPYTPRQGTQRDQHLRMSFVPSLARLLLPHVLCACRASLFICSFGCPFRNCLSFVHSLVRLLLPFMLCPCRSSLFIRSFVWRYRVCLSFLSVVASSSSSACVMRFSRFTLHSFVCSSLSYLFVVPSLSHLPLVLNTCSCSFFIRSFVCRFRICLSFVPSLVRLLPRVLFVCPF